MGARDWHLTRAKRHLEVAEFLATNGHHDWASVALFYSAHQWVHSSLADEPGLTRDERHPRKHTMPAGDDGRGTTQLVAAMYPSIELSYRSLFDMSWRTRYDYSKLASSLGEDQLWNLLFAQYKEIRTFCKSLNGTREKISTQAP
jgi:hypothetical protein